jgi:GR25 family glycosyltransferase involved in LPS biosynthesis
MYPVYCINLDVRKDRKLRSLKEFEKLQIPPSHVIYPHLTKDKRGGVYGSFDSHMKVWTHFMKNYPNEKYCLVFEDDFESTSNSISLMNKACTFLDKHKVDILFLHNLRITVENSKNTQEFTNGYGLCTHAYFITRRYIQSIVARYGGLPEPNGRQFDFSINIDINNKLYSTNLFFTNVDCIKQCIDNSDNYMNTMDRICRDLVFGNDMNKQIQFGINVCLFFKRMNLLGDIQIKHQLFFLMKHLT